jgi:DNA-directed RNA polymerase subunit RPC12/RpoP
MYLAIHVPMFGSPNIETKPIECPYCPRGKELGTNDWEEKDITTCNPGDEFVCKKCGKKVFINWGLEEPDHLSNWLNSEYCPHRLCRIKYKELYTKTS